VHRDWCISTGQVLIVLERGEQSAALLRPGRLPEGAVEDEDCIPAAHVPHGFLLQNPVDGHLVHVKTMLQNRLNDVVAKLVPDKISSFFQ